MVIFQRLHADIGPVFAKTQSEYEKGFGKSHDNAMWLGLDNMHRLTGYGNMRLKVDLANGNERRQTVTYEKFQVGSKSEDYMLNTEGYDPEGSSIPDVFEQSIWRMNVRGHNSRFWTSSSNYYTPTSRGNEIHLLKIFNLAYVIMSIRGILILNSTIIYHHTINKQYLFFTFLKRKKTP